jgi:hypothetical protein
MQLVLSNNRIIAHGENFLSVGGVVINNETGKRYERATVAECDNCPSDIDKVGYEYHAGVFVPCAPFGVGDGNVLVACHKDCKSIKDSGVPFGRMCQVVETTYEGTGGNTVSLTFDAIPVIVFFVITSGSGKEYGFAYDGVCYRYRNGDMRHITDRDERSSSYAVVDGTTIEIHDTQTTLFNEDDAEYKVIAILQGGE